MSGLAVKVRFQPKDVSKIPKKMRKELLAKRRLALLKTAQVGVSIIEDRTETGDGYKGKFEPYTKSYRIWKTKPVNQGGGGHTSTMPNLSLTGFMLGAMITKANPKQAVIFFSNPKDAKKAAMNDKTRPFFGFNRAEKKRLGKAFTRFITL
jgi:hypothetical protein